MANNRFFMIPRVPLREGVHVDMTMDDGNNGRMAIDEGELDEALAKIWDVPVHLCETATNTMLTSTAEGGYMFALPLTPPLPYITAAEKAKAAKELDKFKHISQGTIIKLYMAQTDKHGANLVYQDEPNATPDEKASTLAFAKKINDYYKAHDYCDGVQYLTVNNLELKALPASTIAAVNGKATVVANCSFSGNQVDNRPPNVGRPQLKQTFLMGFTNNHKKTDINPTGMGNIVLKACLISDWQRKAFVLSGDDTKEYRMPDTIQPFSPTHYTPVGARVYDVDMRTGNIEIFEKKTEDDLKRLGMFRQLYGNARIFSEFDIRNLPKGDRNGMVVTDSSSIRVRNRPTPSNIESLFLPITPPKPHSSRVGSAASTELITDYDIHPRRIYPDGIEDSSYDNNNLPMPDYRSAVYNIKKKVYMAQVVFKIIGDKILYTPTINSKTYGRYSYKNILRSTVTANKEVWKKIPIDQAIKALPYSANKYRAMNGMTNSCTRVKALGKNPVIKITNIKPIGVFDTIVISKVRFKGDPLSVKAGRTNSFSVAVMINDETIPIELREFALSDNHLHLHEVGSTPQTHKHNLGDIYTNPLNVVYQLPQPINMTDTSPVKSISITITPQYDDLCIGDIHFGRRFEIPCLQASSLPTFKGYTKKSVDKVGGYISINPNEEALISSNLNLTFPSKEMATEWFRMSLKYSKVNVFFDATRAPKLDLLSHSGYITKATMTEKGYGLGLVLDEYNN